MVNCTTCTYHRRKGHKKPGTLINGFSGKCTRDFGPCEANAKLAVGRPWRKPPKAPAHELHSAYGPAILDYDRDSGRFLVIDPDGSVLHTFPPDLHLHSHILLKLLDWKGYRPTDMAGWPSLRP